MTKLEKLKEYSKIPKHKNGQVLKNIETSSDQNVIPTGDLHKNKHDDFEIDVTPKGIPVITVEDDSVETLPEILALSESVVLHAEVEKEEIIFNKELTDYVEELLKKWNEKESDDIAIEVGKRVVKELLFNTVDNSELINKVEEKL